MTSRTYKRTCKTGLTWSYCLDLGNDPAGKRQRSSKHGFETKREATEAAQRRIREIEAENETAASAAKAPKVHRATFGEYLDKVWFPEYANQSYSPKTLERSLQLALYVSPEIRDTALDELDTLALDREINRLKERGGKNGSPLSAKSVRHVLGVVRAALKQAAILGLIKSNPASLCSLPKVPRPRPKALDLPTTQKLLAALEGHWLYPIVFFGAATGCRRGEILALRWSEVDLMTRNASIMRSLEQTKAGLRIKPPKNEKERDCPLPMTLIKVLIDHRDVRVAGYKQAFGVDYAAAEDLVFPAPHGGFLKPDTITAEACALFAKAGFKGYSLHSLRHSHGSQLLAAGVPLPTVSARLGHSDPSITAKVYSQSFNQQEREAADVWDRLMSGKTGKASRQQMATNLAQVVDSVAALTGFEPVFKP